MADSLLGGLKRPISRLPSKQSASATPLLKTPGLTFLSQPKIETTITAKERDALQQSTLSSQSQLPVLIPTGNLITMYSADEQQRMAGSIRVTQSTLSDYGSVNDPRMGEVSANTPCQNCGRLDCPGHYGLIDIQNSPIYNPLYTRPIVSVLTCVCRNCGKLLTTKEQIEERGINRLPFEKRLMAIEEICKDAQCLAENPALPGGKVISCSRNPIYIYTDVAAKGEIMYKDRGRQDAKPMLEPISSVAKILNGISVEDAKLLGFNKPSHPRNMLLKNVLVPPIIARPPLREGASVHMDQLTIAYSQIIQQINTSMNNDKVQTSIYTKLSELFTRSGDNKNGREMLTLIGRLQGKSALMRTLAMGKRTDYCARTVAGPDPSLRFGEVGIPVVWAHLLTKPVKVTNFNIKQVHEWWDKGMVTHFIKGNTKIRLFYDANFLNNTKYKPKVGDTVERFLQNGDLISTNRQPTLHRQSMMSYNIVLGVNKTIRSHLSTTTPYNCDYDGDENNAWGLQSLEVEAEAEVLMHVTQNIMSTEHNRPIMGLVMNSLVSAYLLTKSNVRVNENLFSELISMLTETSQLKTLSYRLKKYGIHPRSGRAVFSALLPEDFYYQRDPVLIMEGVLVRGRIKKSNIGVSHRSIIQELFHKYGPNRTVSFFTDAPYVLNKWLMERGFSVGMADIVSYAKDDAGAEYDRNQHILKRDLASMYVNIEALGGALKDPMEERYRQQMINNQTNISKEIGVSLAKETLIPTNSIAIMTDQGSGAKGNLFNISQIMGAVGQQFLNGKRLQPTLSGGRRLLPCFDLDDNNPDAHGFVSTSYTTGLSMPNLFFIQAGGREGLLDTAMKTSMTGDLAHRLGKAGENIIIGPNGAVINTTGTIFVFIYNNGFSNDELMSTTVNGQSDVPNFIDIKSVANELNMKRGWYNSATTDHVLKKQARNDASFVENLLPTPSSATIKKPPVTGVKAPTSLTPAPIRALPSKINKYEKARLIGTRAEQLGNNANPLIPIGEEINPLRIATKEFEAGVLPIYVIRKYTNGELEIIRPTKDNI